MRKQSLRQIANQYLTSHQGSHRTRKHRHYVLQKTINDFYVVKCVPPTWGALTAEHLQQLVLHWQKNNISPSTIMKYMTVIRVFLHSIAYQKEIPDNRSLGVVRTTRPIKPKRVSPDIWQKTTDSITRVLLGLQIHFGLTMSEAMRLLPDIHVQEGHLWVTREITFNSMDRVIPLRNEVQQAVIEEFNCLTQGNQNLIGAQGYEVVRFNYRRALRSLKLQVSKSLRYLYARQLYQQLSNTMKHYELSLLIMDEMGLKSRTTLWRYLRD